MVKLKFQTSRDGRLLTIYLFRMQFHQLLSLYLLVLPFVFSDCLLPQYLGSFPVKQAAFLDIVPTPKGFHDLFITSFGGAPFTKGKIRRVRNIESSLMSLSSVRTSMVDSRVTWPNGAKFIHPDVKIAQATSAQRVISCGGFLVPTHGDGLCTVYDFNDETGKVKKIPLASAGRGSFFHQAEFYDVDGDGWMDLITAKAHKPFFSKPITGTLVWFKNPGDSPRLRCGKSKTWEEFELFDGPDVHFALRDLDHDGIPEIIATQFFTQRLTVNWLKPGKSFGGGPDSWEQRIVADDLGSLFNMTLVDLNGDGHEEIVLTNHETDADFSGMYAVEIPKTDFKTAPWPSHPIVTGFPTLNQGIGQASPGGAIPFTLPGSNQTLFALSGDGNQKAYIICKDKADVWSWQKSEFLDTGNTVGAIAISDVTGDGYPELFVPSYEKGEIHVYSYGT